MPLTRPELACVHTAIYELEGPLTILFVVKELALIAGQAILEDVPAVSSERAVSEPSHEYGSIVGFGHHSDPFAALGRVVILRYLSHVDIVAVAIMVFYCHHRSDALQFCGTGPKVERR